MAGSNFSSNASGIYETEEERRRREEAERQQRLVSGPVAPAIAPTPGLTESEVTPGYQYQPARPEPIKQTITIDPVTGQQKMKLEGSVQDLSPANPLTPTVSMPSTPMAPGGMTGPTPEEIMRDQEQRRQYEIMMAQPQAMAAPAVTGPAEPTMLARAPTTTMTDVTAGTTGPVVPPGQAINPETGELYTPVPAAATAPSAAPAAGGGAVLPVSTTVTAPAPSAADVAQRQMMAQDIQEGPVVRQAVAEGAGPMAMNYFNIVQAAQNDPAAMERIARDPNTPEQWRRVAAGQSRMTLDQKRQQERAEAQAKRIIASGDARINRVMEREKSDEGSRLLLAMYEFLLGPNSSLAKLEARKLTMSWDQDTDEDGNTVLVQRRGDGLAVQGIGADQQPMSTETLAKYSGGGVGLGGKSAGFQKGEFMVDENGMPFQTAFNPNNPRRPIITPIGHNEKPKGRLVRSTQSGELAADVQASKKQVDLVFDPKIRSMVTAAEQAVKDNAKYGTNVGVIGMDAQNRVIYVDNNTGRVLQQDSEGRVTATTGGAVPGGTARQDVKLDVLRTAGQEAVKGVENFSQQTSDRAGTAAETAGVARRIRNSVDQNPQVVGLLTKRTDKGTVFDRVINAAVASIDAGLGGSDAIEQAAKQLNLSVPEQTIFEQVKGDLVELALARARENKGQGTFTDFERRLFASTTGDIARNQAAAIKYRMEIFEYAAEKAQRKTQFVEEYRLQNPNATVGRINNAFREYNKPFDEAFEKRLTDTYIRPKKEQVLR